MRSTVSSPTPIIGIAVGAKSNTPLVAQATTKTSKSISGGTILSITDMHGHGLRLKVREHNSKKLLQNNE